MKFRIATNLPKHFNEDAGLGPYAEILSWRASRVAELRKSVLGKHYRLTAAADWHRHYGLHISPYGNWVFREWLPNATEAWLVGEFSNWEVQEAFRLKRIGEDWEGRFPLKKIRAGQQYRLFVRWNGGEGQRIPSATTQVARSSQELWRADVSFNAVVTEKISGYPWQNEAPSAPMAPLIYEAHVGMAQEKNGVGTFDEFRENVLPRVARAGYNTLQLMGIPEHPYSASFGYHVSNFFAVEDLLGTPDDFKALVDAAHGLGLRVIIDLVHSHAATNEVEGLSRMDGTPYLYVHDGPRGNHPAWGSRCFDYGKPQVLRFLLSNCRFWLDEYRIDGFRFDGITSMLYRDHGLGRGAWSYNEYFNQDFCDEDAIAYLTLANTLIKTIKPDATTIAEDVSGFPGLASPIADGGIGFDYRLAMGVTDYWFKLTDIPDEDWHLGTLWYELNSRRKDEKTISYVECHDQALVGGKTFAHTLMNRGIHYGMAKSAQSLEADRGMALHKMARLATFATAGQGYLNFMGNEFGHPDWIDFPTERNGWSFDYARRQWHLVDDHSLKFHYLADFDRNLLALFRDNPDFFLFQPLLLRLDEQAKILAFERNELVFLFNFHPTQSVQDYPVVCFPGTYQNLLDTDAGEFGGFQRIQPGQRFFTSPVQMENRLEHFLRVYLPCRTALVLKREPSPQTSGIVISH
ncbi:MAG: alpha amylase C-terminal domain-containing protein [Victivallales bacterium]|nr:alpha amylase C-terminal domain-containing protein [Victivallales bacterium]